MATNSQNKGITNSWSLVDFKKAHGNLKVTGTMQNSSTGDKFKSCAFVDDKGAVTLVGFSSKFLTDTDKLSQQEIAAVIKSKKTDLQVVQLESGSYKLCLSGSGNWMDIDI